MPGRGTWAAADAATGLDAIALKNLLVDTACTAGKVAAVLGNWVRRRLLRGRSMLVPGAVFLPPLMFLRPHWGVSWEASFRRAWLSAVAGLRGHERESVVVGGSAYRPLMDDQQLPPLIGGLVASETQQSSTAATAGSRAPRRSASGRGGARP